MRAKLKKFLCILLTVMMVMSLFAISPTMASATGKETKFDEYIKYRGQDLKNVYAKLSKNEAINVMYFGGSVTDGSDIGSIQVHSWRERVGEWLIEKFPQATINNFNVAYGGTGTKFGSYRVREEVISKNPDLVFVEFAINDNYDKLSKEEASKYFESIIRQIRDEAPECDIVTVLIADKSTQSPTALHSHAQAHEDICIEYNIPSIHVGRAFAYHFYYNEPSKWNEYFYDSVHPISKGHEYYFNVIKEYLSNCLFYGGYDGQIKNHTVPEKPINEYLADGNIQYFDASEELVSASVALGGSGFQYSDSASKLAWTFLGGLTATGSNPSFVFEFTGTELTMIISSGASQTTAESFTITVDDTISRYVAYSSIRPTILISGLAPGKHKVRILPNFKGGVTTGTVWIAGFLTRDETKATAKYDHLEHVFEKYVSDGNATCKKDGTKTAICKYEGCDKTDTLPDVGSKVSHNYVIVPIKEPTYNKDGLGEKICSMCERFEDYVDIKYSDYYKLVKKSDGKWYLYTNGKYDTTVTALIKHAGKWFFVKNGRWSPTTDLVKYQGKYFYISGGKWYSTTAKLFKKNGKWFAIKSGKWYKGENIIKHSGKKFYVNKGFAQLSYSGKKKINGKTYKIKKGKVV